eukprot:11847346-Alexandrium_andersonii.AAC.1
MGSPFPVTAQTPRAGHPVPGLEPSFVGDQPTDSGASWRQEGEQLVKRHQTLSEDYWRGRTQELEAM